MSANVETTNTLDKYNIFVAACLVGLIAGIFTALIYGFTTGAIVGVSMFVVCFAIYHITK